MLVIRCDGIAGSIQICRQLGDGRAVSAGVLAAPPIDGAGTDALRVPWEIAIKGAGPTPFSRRGDGRAVLQSNCREFLGSVALHALGIPTQRSLCVVAAGIDFDGIVRDEHCGSRLTPRCTVVAASVTVSA